MNRVSAIGVAFSVWIIGLGIFRLFFGTSSQRNTELVLLALASGTAAIFTLVRTKKDDRRGWRIHCVSGTKWNYEEKAGTEWRSLSFNLLRTSPDSNPILAIPSQENWKAFPGWAADRRELIVERLKTELKNCDFVDA
jgi:hypothetical protein